MTDRNPYKVELTPRGQPDLKAGRRSFASDGVMTELVTVDSTAAFDFRWAGTTDYVALHDMRLADGETALDGSRPVRRLDLRDRMTFLPRGCNISGWSRLKARNNAYTALYFDQATIAEEQEFDTIDGRSPLLYFDDAGLRTTLTKIRDALEASSTPDQVYLETLALLAAIEVSSLSKARPRSQLPRSVGLSTRTQRLVQDFVAENLHHNITLSELAGLSQLSRFHFARSFKMTIGLPPHQYVLRCRIERAKINLRNNKLAIREIAYICGFTSHAHFSAMFLKIVGCTPDEYRRNVGG